MKAPAFQLYVRDWICSLTIKRMTGDEAKAFMYLLCWSWLETPRATLPNDDDQLAAMANLSLQDWDRVKGRVKAAFTLGSNGRLTNERLSQVSESQNKFVEWGKKGGNPSLKNKTRVNGGDKPTLNLSSSSSSSSLPSNIPPAAEESLKHDLNPPKPKKSVPPQRHAFMKLWNERFSQCFMKPYFHTGSQDEVAADKLLSSFEPEYLVQVAEKIWKTDGFYQPLSLKISSFASNFNNIQGVVGELKAKKSSPSVGTGIFAPGAEMDPEKWEARS